MCKTLFLSILQAMGTAFKGIALCAVGLEKITAQELVKLGLKPQDRRPGRIGFALESDRLATDLARANIGLRTAERVLLELGRFPAPDFDAYFEGIASLPWELCCYKDSKIHIGRVRSKDSRLASQASLQAMGQKAAYSRLMDSFDMRTMPETGNSVGVRIYLDRDECSVGIDTSGEPLHKRGYRRRTVQAPLKETIAASLLFFSGWNRKFALLDPFCGSGSIAIEAALYALDFAPGLTRRFAFELMPAMSPKQVYAVREDFESRIRNDVEVEIRASDIDPGAVETAKANAADAGLRDWIEFSCEKAQDLSPFDGKGHLLANPPYGKRLGSQEEALSLYADLAPMRDRFRDGGWNMGFITDREDFGEIFGLKPTSVHHLFNGAEEQWFHWYPGKEEKNAAVEE
ncbi:rRNA (Guanine-N(2)-)-methyltransferase [uncultured Spirochaetota bacterium]|uniref:rRNA (Guanine-N(2)-)-methyltransferase n=1 Tax=uncultured Spirochaetota bacterium TaxID=460511 RepID=A0A652ZRT1_9SPIR|nr:rRNA (Guanine-N(2)-)-methyltransferase [uncultured Spirochaetota bacterium]